MQIIERPLNEKNFSALLDAAVPTFLAKIYARRGVKSPVELDYTLRRLSSFQGMLGVDAAASRLAQAITAQERIAICGDYDCDGACASALLIEAIQDLGGKEPDLYIPDRIRQGYGLSPGLVEEIAPETSLLITVDNGISAFDGIAAAAGKGIEVIVTDHHLAGATIPRGCVSVMDPNQPGCPFPWKSTAGVGVAFYLIAATRSLLGKKEVSLSKYLDLVALATVADVVPLEFNNRIFVDAGLRLIRKGECRPAILQLLEISHVNPKQATTESLAFSIAPKLNAAGRMDDMRLGVRLLLSKDMAEVASLSTALASLNEERKQVESQMCEEAQRLADRLSVTEGVTICSYQEDWHEGVVGIVASRLRDRYHRPAFVFAKNPDGTIKGSGRSISGFHLRDALAQIQIANPGLLQRFGGHAMAAGVTLSCEKDLHQFQRAFEAVAQASLSPKDLQACWEVDGQLDEKECSLGNAKLLEFASPWGKDFPEPSFFGEFTVQEAKRMGADQGSMRMKLSFFDQSVTAVRFRCGDEPLPAPGDRVSLVYRLKVNRWNGQESLQLMVDAIAV